jgi:hypothetical protein
MTEQKFGFFCKSFKPDFDHLAELLKSFRAHNPERLTLTLSLPNADIPAFRDRFGRDIPNLRVVTDEEYCGLDLTRLPGWYGQQLCKLASWRATEADHYAVLDSDCYFIKDARARDLMPSEGKKYVACGSELRTVFGSDGNEALLRYIKGDLVPGKEVFPPLRTPIKCNFSELKSHRDTSLDVFDLNERSALIFRLFGAGKWYFFQPCQIFSKELLISLENFLAENDLSQEQAISIAPWEYNWYGEYAACMKSAETCFKVSPFFHVANQKSVDLALQNGLTEAVLSRKFIWVAMAARHLSLLRLQPS